MPIQFQTQLPDVDALALDASIEDQVTANPATSPSLNHGEWHVEYRESDAATWTTWGTTEHSTDPTITGLLDGEEYDVRARSQTADVTGASYTATGVTLLPQPTDVTFSSVGETNLDVSWTDTADNEIEQAVQRRRVDYESAPWATVATVDPNVESYPDAAVQPGREYEYRVQTTTEHVYAISDAATVETTDLGVPKTRTRRQAWTVEIVAPTGEVIRPNLAGTPQWQPEVTAMPRCRLPVADRPRWHRNDLLGSDATDVRVWYRGHQLPIDSIVRTEPEPGQVTLVCRGASQLDTDVPSEQIDEQETHLALRDLVDEYTDYEFDIDDPASGTQSDVEMIPETGIGRPEDFRDALAIEFDAANPGEPVDGTIPIRAFAGEGLRTTQTCFAREAENGNYTGSIYLGDNQPGYDGEWSGGQAVRLNSVGDAVSVSCEYAHTVPDGDLHARVLFAVDDGDAPALEFTLNGTVVDSTTRNALLDDGSPFATDYFQTTLNSDGSHTGTTSVGIEVTDADSSTGDVYVDLVAIYDSRYSYTFQSDFTGDAAAGPERYPEAFAVETVGTSSVEQVIAGRLDVTVDDTSNEQALGVSNDQGSSWKRGSNTDSYAAAFDAAGQQIRGEITLSRHGSQTTTPTQGSEPQTVTSLALSADLDDTPVLLDQEYSGDLVEICQQAADAGDFVLEARRDPAAAWDDPTGIIIEGAVAGQRSRDRIPEDLVDYSAATTVERSYDEIVVEGAATAVSGEAFSASDYDLLIGLDEGPVVPASETVVDPSDDTAFERGTDYRPTWTGAGGDAIGGIELIESGDMEPGTTYEIDYRYTFQGSASSSGVSDPRTRRVEIPDATSDRECDQLALSILKRVQAPLEEAEVTVATDDPTVSLIAALAHPDLPLDDELVIRSSEFGTGEVRYQLGSRQSFADVIEEIESQFRALASRV